MRSLDWMDDALCAQVDPDLWFPTTGEDVAGRTRQAKTICNRCPVRSQCDSHAAALEGTTERTARHGIWAATTAKQRWTSSNKRAAA